MEANKKVAQVGGKIAKNTRDNIEEYLENKIVTKQNKLAYEYEDQILENK